MKRETDWRRKFQKDGLLSITNTYEIIVYKKQGHRIVCQIYPILNNTKQ
jgi:hypothetical protein